MPFLRTGLVLALLFTPAVVLAGPPPKHHRGGAHHPRAHHSSHPHAHAHTTLPARQHISKVKLDASTPGAAPKHDALGKSVGSPTEGRLVGGVHLTESPYLRIVPAYAPGDARWGVEPLVSAIDRAARAVRKQFPDAVASVGHRSRQGGGEIDRHASHESGRDADIGFYVRNEQGKGIYADHFVAFKGDGTAASWPGAHFDDARNWAFVAAIAGDAHAHVTHIFIASPLRARLMQYAEKVGAPLSIRTRASELMAQPKGALPHDDHFHVRVACPAGSEQGSSRCIEQPAVRKQRHAGGSHHGSLAQSSPQAHRILKSPAVPPGHPAPPPPPPHPATKPEPKSPPPPDDDKSEASSVPNLAPMVPGLDSAVIAAPLAGSRPSVAPIDKPAIPIDDPDGVLDPF